MLSSVQLFATPWTIARRVPPSMEFSRQEYWSRLPFPPPADLPDPGIEPASPLSPALAGRLFITEPPGKHTEYRIAQLYRAVSESQWVWMELGKYWLTRKTTPKRWPWTQVLQQSWVGWRLVVCRYPWILTHTPPSRTSTLWEPGPLFCFLRLELNICGMFEWVQGLWARQE